MKKIFLTVNLILLTAVLWGQSVNVRLENRDSWTCQQIDGTHIDESSGFKGERLSLKVSGTMGDKWSYGLHQHLNRPISKSDVFSSTDWMYVQFNPDDHWQFLAGKWMVECGGVEYYEMPVDIYFAGEYFNNYHIFLFGLSAGYWLEGHKDIITAQVAQSPFEYLFADTYSYNLSWRGHHGCYEAEWSANLYQYGKNGYLTNLAFGNRLQFGRLKWDLDLISRADAGDFSLFKDFSVMTKLQYDIIDGLDVFAKFCADRNLCCETDYDVYLGTDLRVIGGGVEYFPVKGSDTVRIHCTYNRTYGTAPSAAVLSADVSSINIGITLKALLFGRR